MQQNRYTQVSEILTKKCDNILGRIYTNIKMSNVSLKDIEYNLGDIVRELLNLANDVNTNIHTIGLL
jgi:hypothetical protein